MNKLPSVYILLFFVCCNTDQYDKQFKQAKQVKLDNGMTAICNSFINDSIFNGPVIMLDKNETLVGKYNYTNGILNGEANEFYTSGTLKFKMSYLNGELNGDLFFFDSLGKFISKDFYYYGLKVGGRLETNTFNDSSYIFTSLENDELYKLEYKKLKTSDIVNLDNNFFNYYISADSIANNAFIRPSIFLYTLSPPHFNFEYSLVRTNTNYLVLEILQKLTNNNSPFVKTYLKEDELYNNTGKKHNTFFA